MGVKLTTLAAFLLPLLAGAMLAGRGQAAGDGGDREKIRGAWSVEAGEKAGQKAPADALNEGRMTFGDGTFTWKIGDHESKGTFTLDGSTTPGRIDLTLGDKKLGGIYRLSGDDLKICVGAGDDRPADFATAAGAKAVLLVLKRATP